MPDVFALARELNEALIELGPDCSQMRLDALDAASAGICGSCGDLHSDDDDPFDAYWSGVEVPDGEEAEDIARDAWNAAMAFMQVEPGES